MERKENCVWIGAGREKEMKNIVNFSVAFSAFGLLTVATSADIIQSESFEDYSVGSGQYVSEMTGDHWLENYDDHTVTGAVSYTHLRAHET